MQKPLLFVTSMFLVSSVPLSDAFAQNLSRASDSILRDGFSDPDAGPYSDADAARFLAQATFGPTPGDIADLRAQGYHAWLAKQEDATQTPPTHAKEYLAWLKTVDNNASTTTDGLMESWFLGALGGPDPANANRVHSDQLRQRVAFALSEIFVTSDRLAVLYRNPESLYSYYDILTDDAFGNYRDLLKDVTLSPAMGGYLSMLNNQKPNATYNIRPDENYAREILQLFSIGLVQLNGDGTTPLVSGQPIPTYDQSTVQGFARIFTGWSYNGCTTGFWTDPLTQNCPPDFVDPMTPVEQYHDESDTKQLLSYSGTSGLTPAGGQAQADLDNALDNVFNHPNVGPFISKQLIQRLVTSNPSPAYVARVATVFNNNGQGVRGDLRAVVDAVLLDREARSGQWLDPVHFGKVREPLLRLTHFWRVLGARHYGGDGNPYRYTEYHPENVVDEAPLRAPSVFNFFRPDFAPKGEIAQVGLVAPEMQISTDSVTTEITNTFNARIFYMNADRPNTTCGSAHPWGDVCVDLTQEALIAADPQALVSRYDLLFLSGQMSPYMRTTLVNFLTSIHDNTKRVQYALSLILTSPEYLVQQ
ncbi:MAG TPA: DUF1800 domain-containing protein [Rudaea sp.]|nr:DUF1800 domain-containing protein [Rudaea sp.]